jgi:hypothetical protein
VIVIIILMVFAVFYIRSLGREQTPEKGMV